MCVCVCVRFTGKQVAGEKGRADENADGVAAIGVVFVTQLVCRGRGEHSELWGEEDVCIQERNPHLNNRIELYWQTTELYGSF